MHILPNMHIWARIWATRAPVVQKMKNLDLNCLSFGMHFLQVDLTLFPLTLSNSYHSRQVCNHSELGV